MSVLGIPALNKAGVPRGSPMKMEKDPFSKLRDQKSKLELVKPQLEINS